MEAFADSLGLAQERTVATARKKLPVNAIAKIVTAVRFLFLARLDFVSLHRLMEL